MDPSAALLSSSVESPLAWLLSSALGVGVAAAFGAVWGSFFNVCVARVPRGQSVVRPGSRCGSCGAPIRAADNIPILSYFLRRGRCRACGAPFSARYAVIEAVTALLAAALWWQLVTAAPAEPPAVRLARFAFYFAFAGVLVVLSFIDLETKLLPDIITLPAIPLLYLAGFGAHDAGWRDRLIGLGAGYLFIRLIADFYYYVLKREALGLGDAKLLALIGAVLGWQSLPVVVFAGALLGTLLGLPALLVARRRGASAQALRDVQIPFGPFLALGALGHLFWGRELVRWLGG